MSPSRISSLEPRSRSSFSRMPEIVVLPAPESPVNQRVNPFSPAIATSVLLVSVDQNVRHLVARELLRRPFAVAEHLAHLGAAQEHVGLGAVRAGLARRHPLALVAPEAVLEEERLDAQLLGVHLVEDVLRVVGAV